MTRYFGKICEKHPECNGERTTVRRQCVGCKADYRKSRREDYGREYLRKYRAKRKRVDPVFNLRLRMARRLRHVLRGENKSEPTQVIIGCNWLDLKYHIESQFHDGMSWDNMGEWEVDHVTPLASAKTVNDVIRLLHYTNLQPLWAHENRAKGSKTAVDGLHRTK